MIHELGKAMKEKSEGKKKDTTIYKNGYYSLGGFIAGFLLVQMWNKFDIPYLDHKIKHSLVNNRHIDNHKGTTVDKTIAIILSTSLMMSELVGVKGGLASGSGLLLGYTIATALRKDKYVGAI